MPLLQEIARGVTIVQQRRRRCHWCRKPLEADAGSKFCSHRCELEMEYWLST